MKKIIFRRPSKKAIVLGCIGLAVLLLVGYVTFSLLAWQQHQQVVENQAKVWGEEVDTIIALDSAEHEEVGRRITEYQRQTASASCEPGVLIGWQQHLVAFWKSSVARCQADVAHHEGLGKKLDRVAHYLRGQGEVTALLRAVGDLPDTQGADEWQASRDAWQDIINKLDAIERTDDLEPLLKATKTASSAIVEAWKHLLEAHEGQDAGEFRQAREGLNETYAGLGELAEVNQRQLEILIDDFTSTYDRSGAKKA